MALWTHCIVFKTFLRIYVIVTSLLCSYNIQLIISKVHLCQSESLYEMKYFYRLTIVETERNITLDVHGLVVLLRPNLSRSLTEDRAC